MENLTLNKAICFILYTVNRHKMYPSLFQMFKMYGNLLGHKNIFQLYFLNYCFQKKSQE